MRAQPPGQRHPLGAHVSGEPVAVRQHPLRGARGPPNVAHRGAGHPLLTDINRDPLSADVVLQDPAAYETDMTVPLTLTFRHWWGPGRML